MPEGNSSQVQRQIRTIRSSLDNNVPLPPPPSSSSSSAYPLVSPPGLLLLHHHHLVVCSLKRSITLSLALIHPFFSPYLYLYSSTVLLGKTSQAQVCNSKNNQQQQHQQLCQCTVSIDNEKKKKKKISMASAKTLLNFAPTFLRAYPTRLLCVRVVANSCNKPTFPP